MDKLYKCLSIFVLGALLIAGCGNSSKKDTSKKEDSLSKSENIKKDQNKGEIFLGTWESVRYIGYQITFTKHGDLFILKGRDYNDPFTFSNGVLKDQSGLMNVTYDTETGHIYFSGDEYKKVK